VTKLFIFILLKFYLSLQTVVSFSLAIFPPVSL